jgi:GH15 family glucan-1,4-alpha-glucosidase
MGLRDPLPAISMLAPALFGLIDPLEETVTRSIEYLRKHLWDPEMGGLYRYPLHLQPWQELPYGGPWVTYTSWLGRVHVLRGEMGMAADLIKWAVANIPRDSNLVPEHFSVAHCGRRGFHRIYLDPSAPEVWATAEFLRFVHAFREAGVAG